MPSFSLIRIASLVLLGSSSVFAAPITKRQLSDLEGLSGIVPLGLGHGPVCPGGVCPSEGLLKRQSPVVTLSVTPLPAPTRPPGECSGTLELCDPQFDPPPVLATGDFSALLKRQDSSATLSVTPLPTPTPAPIPLPSVIGLQGLKTLHQPECDGSLQVCDPQAVPGGGFSAIASLFGRADPLVIPTPPIPSPLPSGILQSLTTLHQPECDGSLQVCDPQAVPNFSAIASLAGI